jgi:hypothetical protein
VIIELPKFRRSLPHLRGVVALSEHSAAWLKRVLKLPVLAVKHPTEVPTVKFCWRRCEEQCLKRLVQVGWYARNIRGIYQVKIPEGFQKVHLLQDQPWVLEAIGHVDEWSPCRSRPGVGRVKVVRRLDDDDYDILLSKSIMFSEYLDVSASNAIIEAIARNTPIVTNRRPALEEYLGRSYPLFYERLEDVSAMLSDRVRLRAAHEALCEMDKQWLSVEHFWSKLAEFVETVAPRRSGG